MKNINSLRYGLLTLLFLALATLTRAQGTIGFPNGSLTRYSWNASSFPVPVVFGVFWGTNANELNMVFPLGTGSVSQAGIILAPSVYPIPSTEPGQTVYLQIKGWAASYGTNWMEARLNFASYGQTDIRQVTLGQTAGPGTVIWQSSSGGNPNRFYPLVLGNPLTPPSIIQLGQPLNNPVTVDEGSRGTVVAIIPVVRYTPPGHPTDLNFVSSAFVCTTNMTALEGEDYVATNSVVTFNPGETLKHVRITILADANPEPDEQFGVYLKSNGSFVSLDQYVLAVNIREARLVSVRWAGSQSVVSFRTTSSQRYAVEYSTNLTNWATLPGAADIAGNGATIEFTDAEGGCCGNRFYRARLLPE